MDRSIINQDLFDTPPEKDFDDLVKLASVIFKTPISSITLLDGKRQWFKARVGLEVSETPIAQSFCRHAVTQPREIMVVKDATRDPRFKENDYVKGEPLVRFYAGAPLLTPEGEPYGTLCVIDNVPREFSSEEKYILKILAAKAMELVELRNQQNRIRKRLAISDTSLEAALERLIVAQEVAKIGSWEWKVQSDELYFTPEMFRLLDLEIKSKTPSQIIDHLKSRIATEDAEKLNTCFNKALDKGKCSVVEFRLDRKDGRKIWLEGRINVSQDETGSPVKLSGTVQDINEKKLAEERAVAYTSSLEELLYALSHKIRRPVATMLGMTQVLTEDSLDEKKLRQYADYFKKNAEELDAVVKEMNELLSNRKAGM